MKTVGQSAAVLRFWFIEDLPEAGQKQQDTEKLYQKAGIDPCANPGEEGCGNTAGDDGRENRPDLDATLLNTEYTGNDGGGEKEQQIHTSGCLLLHMKDHGEPKDQQTAAADTYACKKAKNCADGHKDRETF